MNWIATVIALFFFFPILVKAQEEKPVASAEELARKLSNPAASLISMPFQNNTDVGIGEFNGSRNTLNFQPVVPIKINPKLNLITRVIIPIVSQQNITSENVKQSGVADAVLSGFFSPAESRNGFTWGAGPVMLLPIATNDFLGSKKFAIGPTALVLKQFSGWTIGALANQLWSVAGDEERNDISQLLLQQFTVYNWKSGAGLGLITEWTQDWKASVATVFMTPQITAVTRLGRQTTQVGIGPRIPVSAPGWNKADFGVRAQLGFVFPQ
jgi:hypothetical protein